MRRPEVFLIAAAIIALLAVRIPPEHIVTLFERVLPFGILTKREPPCL